MQAFVLVSEEAISKGIRRIVALTGPEALKAINKCDLLQNKVNLMKKNIGENMNTNGFKFREAAQEIAKLGEVLFVQIMHTITN